MSILIKNGNAVSSETVFKTDILISGEKILKIGDIAEQEVSRLCPDDPLETVTDASGKYIFPGFIDAHTHFDLHVAGTVTCDDFYSGTKAAVAGGTTTIIDFASAYKGESLMEGLLK